MNRVHYKYTLALLVLIKKSRSSSHVGTREPNILSILANCGMNVLIKMFFRFECAHNFFVAYLPFVLYQIVARISFVSE